MDFDMPEANLYRYIQDCGGLVGGLTPSHFGSASQLLSRLSCKICVTFVSHYIVAKWALTGIIYHVYVHISENF